MRAHYALAATSLWRGELIAACEHFAQGIALYDSQQCPTSALLETNDLGVICQAETALALWLLGYTDQAQEKIQQALALARKIAFSHSLADALDSAATFYQLRREEQTAQEQAAAEIALATEQGFPLWVAYGTITHGWALAIRMKEKEGIRQICQGLTAHQATGAKLGRPHHLALLAEVYGQVGQPEAGLAHLAEALTLVHTTGECFYEAEIYRLKGELTLQQFKTSTRQVTRKFRASRSKSAVPNPQPLIPNPQEEAEACFLTAIDIARRQSAKSWELRASTSLARLWRSQGKKKEAHKLLAEIYGWFTEGFDTKDLQEAKALLEELNQ